MAMFGSSEGSMDVHQFMVDRRITVERRPDRTDRDALLGEIAAHAIGSIDAAKLLRQLGYSVTNSKKGFDIRLNDGPSATNAAVRASERLASLGILSHVRVDEPNRRLHVGLSRR